MSRVAAVASARPGHQLSAWEAAGRSLATHGRDVEEGKEGGRGSARFSTSRLCKADPLKGSTLAATRSDASTPASGVREKRGPRTPPEVLYPCSSPSKGVCGAPMVAKGVAEGQGGAQQGGGVELRGAAPRKGTSIMDTVATLFTAKRSAVAKAGFPKHGLDPSTALAQARKQDDCSDKMSRNYAQESCHARATAPEQGDSSDKVALEPGRRALVLGGGGGGGGKGKGFQLRSLCAHAGAGSAQAMSRKFARSEIDTHWNLRHPLPDQGRAREALLMSEVDKSSGQCLFADCVGGDAGMGVQSPVVGAGVGGGTGRGGVAKMEWTDVTAVLARENCSMLWVSVCVCVRVFVCVRACM